MSNPIIMKIIAVKCAVGCSKLSSLFETSKKFREPVRTNKIPTPKTKNVAPIVPNIKYLYEASSALLSFPRATRIYVPREEISIKTNALNASAVAITPARPAKVSKNAV